MLDQSSDQCPDCKISDIISTSEYKICSTCGLVIDVLISEKDTTNFQSFQTINDFTPELSTFLQKGSKTFICKDGKYLPCDIYKLHIQNSYNNKQRSYNKASDIFDNHLIRYSQKINDTAKQLWSSIMKTGKIYRAEPRSGLMACCVYFSCIHNSRPCNVKDLCSMFNVDSKYFNKGLKEFRVIFENDEQWSHILTKTLTKESYIYYYCSELEQNNVIENYSKIANECQMLCQMLCERSGEGSENNFNDFNINIYVASLIYVTCLKNGILITKIKFSKLLNICYHTFCKCVKDLTDLCS